MCVAEDFYYRNESSFGTFNYTIEIYNFRMTPNLVSRGDGEIMEIL